MGYGAYMNIVNTTDQPVTTTVGDMNCMYDDGDEGSNIQAWANVTIPPKGESPGGQGQYVEAKGSGSCAFESSWFEILVAGLGGFTISGGAHEYDGSTDQPQHFTFAIAPGDQATIRVLVA